MLLIEQIKKDALASKVIVFFDMDGVCAEYSSGEGDAIKNNEPGLYLRKRPIISVLKLMQELNKVENIQVRILSSCYYNEQKQDKLTWLGVNAPFVKQDYIKIVILKEEIYDKETKDLIKSKYIKAITEGSKAKIYLIEDDHGIIRATKKALPEVEANHISTLIQ